MPSINGKYLKLGSAGLAAAALAIGLSVGLARDRRSRRAGTSSANLYDAGAASGDFDRDSLAICSASTSSGKSGKSGGGKSGGKSGRRLVVPGTEGYAGGPPGGDGRRRKLRNELARELKSGGSSDAYYPTYSPTTYSYGSKSGKSGGGGKSGKSGDDGVTSTDESEMCIRPDNICSYSFTSDGSSSGKSGKSGGGKSGGGKSGKSGGSSSYSYSGKSGKSGGGKSGGGKSGGGCGKGGKSGGGKSGKSGGGKSGGGYSYSYSGKSGKSGSYDSRESGDDEGDFCPSVAPTVCDQCVCEDEPFYFIDGGCQRSCDLSEQCDATLDQSPVWCDTPYFPVPSNAPEIDSIYMCCDANTEGNDPYSSCLLASSACSASVCEDPAWVVASDDLGCDYVTPPSSSEYYETSSDCCSEVPDAGCRMRDICRSEEAEDVPPEPTYFPTDPPADPPAQCVCEDQPMYYVADGNRCERSCARAEACDRDPSMPYCSTGDTSHTIESCCEDNALGGDVLNCRFFSFDCGQAEVLPPTPAPTAGSTPTVSTEATGPPTRSGRGD